MLVAYHTASGAAACVNTQKESHKPLSRNALSCSSALLSPLFKQSRVGVPACKSIRAALESQVIQNKQHNVPTLSALAGALSLLGIFTSAAKAGLFGMLNGTTSQPVRLLGSLSG